MIGRRLQSLRFFLGDLLVAFLMVASPAFAGGQAPAPAGNSGKPAKETAVQFIEFDHLNTDGNRAYVLRLSDAEPFQVRILNTCPDVFSYEVQGILREEKQSGGLGLSAGKALETKTLPVIHDERYGGYLVTIRRTLDTNPCADSEKLAGRTLMISTPKMTWDLAFSGGFTLSSLNSPHYYLRPHPTETGKNQVQEDVSKNDDANLGIATYVQVYHHRLPWLAGTFGLGIRDQNKTEYFLGGGFRMSDKASINGGVVFGPVIRLKDGVNVGDAVTDSNVLGDLPTRTQRGFFVGLSYSFIDVRGKLQQPFAGASGASGATGTSATGNASVAACLATFDKDSVTVGKAVNDTVEVKITVAPAGCAWKVTGGAPAWATLNPMSGSGNATLTIKATMANDTAADRPSTKVDIGGKTLTITQSK